MCLALCASAAAGEALDAGELAPPEQLAPAQVTAPPGALAPGATADVALQLTIDEQGQVSAAVPEAGTDAAPTLIDAAVEATRALRFRPATVDGVPRAVVVRYVVHFAERDEGEATVDEGSADAGSQLRGTVFSRGTRDAVAGASVYLDDAGDPAAETDADGRFGLPLPAGAHHLEVRAAGHLPASFDETLGENQSLDVTYRIVRQFQNPYETVVREKADRAEVARVELSGAELREVAGTQGEPLRVVMLMPGVSAPASGISYPIVRGASPAATGFFLDDVQIPQLYHLLLGPSVVHPDFIERVDFFSSNAPVRFGRVTAGVVSATTSKPRDDRIHASAYVDVINAGGFVEVPIEKTGTNIAVAGRVSYTGFIGGLVGRAVANGATPVADFYDYQARVEQKVGRATVRLLGFGSSDLVGVRPRDPKTEQSQFISTAFHRADLRAQVPLGPGVFEAGVTVGKESGGLEASQNDVALSRFLMNRTTVGGRLRYRVEGQHWQLKAGADIERQQAKIELLAGSSDTPYYAPSTLGVFSGAFIEGSYFDGPLTVVAGVRGDSYLLAPSLYRFSADPRLEVRVAVTDWLTARASAGLFHQAPMLLINLPVTDAAALGDGLHTVVQSSLGAMATLPLGLQLSVDGFYNHLLAARERSLRQFFTGTQTVDDLLAATRTGRAYGLEVMLRSPAKSRFFGWLSYSLMRSERQRRYAVFDSTYTYAGQEESLLPFTFDQSHVVNLVAGYQLPLGFKISGTFHFNTGRPESGEFGSRTRRVVETPEGPAWQLVPLSEVDRLPPFWRLDVRASKTFVLDVVTLELYLDVLNVAGRSEVFSYTYLFDDRGAPRKEAAGVPIFYPSLGLKGTY